MEVVTMKVMKAMMDLMIQPIIKWFTDTDLYKFTMQQAVFHQYPNARVKYTFICRSKGQKLGYLANIVNAQAEMMANLRLTQIEKDFMAKIRFMKPDYIDFLSKFRFDPRTIHAWSDDEGYLHIDVEGLWVDTILWETPILAIVSEAYFRTQPDANFARSYKIAMGRLVTKAKLINEYHLPIVDMGSRRRFSFELHDKIVGYLAKHCSRDDFMGTSNVYLAMKYGLKAFGTQAHEWYMAHLSFVDNVRQAQKRAMHVWQAEYDDDLGYVLSDTFTTKAFFMDFDNTLTISHQGPRQDSGNPYTMGDETIKHYQKRGIDPLTKSYVCSDSLRVSRKVIVPLFLYFVRRIKISFGVGTDITNDTDREALKIVMKMCECNGKPVVKLSDDPGKEMGDPAMIAAIKAAYGI